MFKHTAIFEIGFHTLHKKIVSETLTQNTLVLTRIVSMQGLLRHNYAVLLFQNTVTASVLYSAKCMVARENRSESYTKLDNGIQYSETDSRREENGKDEWFMPS
jgi:hypothetical protein